MAKVVIEARAQFREFLESDKRWAVGVAHRRAGKTVACIQKLTKEALECQKPEGRFAYVAPYFSQAKDVAWSYLKRYAAALGCETNESELRIDFPNGARIRLYGADNPDRLRGLYLDGIVLDEYADMRPSVWGEVIRPMLADRQGWAVFIGTPKGRNDFCEVWEKALQDPTWFRFMLKASETGLIDAGELVAAKAAMTPEQYEQEFECSFEAAILGAFYAQELGRANSEGRVTTVPIDRGLPVHTGWDLGFTDATAIWFFQVVGREIRVIDYYEASGVALDHYVKALKEKGYLYGQHYFPHDVAQHELITGTSRFQTLVGLGITPTVVPQHAVMDGINAVRRMLDRCIFDAGRTAKGREALIQYRRDFDERLKQFKQKPLHDWTSHGADAFRTFAAGFAEPKVVERERYKYRPSKGSGSSWMAA